MTDEQEQLVLVVADNVPLDIIEKLQEEMNRNDMRHILVVAASLMALSPHMTSVLNDVIGMRVRAPSIAGLFKQSVLRDQPYPKYSYHDTFTDAQRRSQINLAGHYTQVAKWRSGAQHAAHREHKNRHAERMRNYRALTRG